MIIITFIIIIIIIIIIVIIIIIIIIIIIKWLIWGASVYLSLHISQHAYLILQAYFVTLGQH